MSPQSVNFPRCIHTTTGRHNGNGCMQETRLRRFRVYYFCRRMRYNQHGEPDRATCSNQEMRESEPRESQEKSDNRRYKRPPFDLTEIPVADNQRRKHKIVLETALHHTDLKNTVILLCGFPNQTVLFECQGQRFRKKRVFRTVMLRSRFLYASDQALPPIRHRYHRGQGLVDSRDKCREVSFLSPSLRP